MLTCWKSGGFTWSLLRKENGFVFCRLVQFQVTVEKKFVSCLPCASTGDTCWKKLKFLSLQQEIIAVNPMVSILW